MEFLVGGEEFRAAAHAIVGALTLLFELLVNFPKGAFGASLSGDRVRLRRQTLFPVFIIKNNSRLGHGFFFF